MVNLRQKQIENKHTLIEKLKTDCEAAERTLSHLKNETNTNGDGKYRWCYHDMNGKFISET
eukprot:UN21764